MAHERTTVTREVPAIQIPDGIDVMIPEGDEVWRNCTRRTLSLPLGRHASKDKAPYGQKRMKLLSRGPSGTVSPDAAQ